MTSKHRPIEKTFNLGTATFVLDATYSDLKVLGQGSYGVVVSAQWEKLGKKVAIKKVTPVAKHVVDAKHVLREVRLLRHMGKHENIISLEDLIYREVQDELYIVMELMDTDLHQVIQSKQPLTEIHFQHFMYQLLCGLKYLHDNRIIHRDLKPGNLLVSRDCRLRITDFGLSRERPKGSGEHQDDDIDEPMTQHVVTRWYRPPELMLCPDGLYTYAVDIWSVGCIFAEMLGRNPLFPGKNFIHQLMLVFDVIGSPLPQEVRHIVNPEARKFLSSQTSKPKVLFSKLYPSASNDAWWLLDQMLIFDPDKRISVTDALEFRYFNNCARQLPASSVFPDVSDEFEFQFERENLTRTQLKQLIQRETQSFKREKQRETIASNTKNPQSSKGSTSDQAGAALEQAAKRSASIGSTLNPHPKTAANTNQTTTEPTTQQKASAEEGRKASVMANYLKNTAASNTRSNSTSRLRPTSNTTTTTAASSSAVNNAVNDSMANNMDSTNAKPKAKRVSTTLTARDVLREMMEPDAYDFLDIHNHTKKKDHTQMPTSPKKSIVDNSNHSHTATTKAVKDVEESLTARLSKIQFVGANTTHNHNITNNTHSSSSSKVNIVNEARNNEVTRDMISETIAAVMNSPSRQKKAVHVPSEDLLPEDNNINTSPVRKKKSLLETYTSPKRLNHNPIFEGIDDHTSTLDNNAFPPSPLLSMMKSDKSKAVVSSARSKDMIASKDNVAASEDNQWARKSDRWEKLQAEQAHNSPPVQQNAPTAGYDSADEKEKNFLRRSAALRQSQQLQQQWEKQQHESSLRTSNHPKVPSLSQSQSQLQQMLKKPPSRYESPRDSDDNDVDDRFDVSGNKHKATANHSDSEEDEDDDDSRDIVPTTARTIGTQASTVVAGHGLMHDHHHQIPNNRRHSSGSTTSSHTLQMKPAVVSSHYDTAAAAITTASSNNNNNKATVHQHTSNKAFTSSNNLTHTNAAPIQPSEKDRKRKITVPKSPKFSTMSWQRRQNPAQQQQQQVEDEFLGFQNNINNNKSMPKARAASTGRAFSKHL